ncbi:hypothetical protein [Humibacter ginsenosidimutans]|uniref:Uncharacterized protein n=1 Tax=Humibacter ginsenosidimutans TaxID=2599293 RepID=A0A5B8M2H6_9MICO|nr:hypothetical protein [Humibacter ginsenosidimutans]QDZ14301.1 hypothetical protein FPZ11_05535 [Humibacter ginsenosidimutans]
MTGAAANTSVVATAGAGESVPASVASPSRVARAKPRTRATKGAGVVAARTGVDAPSRAEAAASVASAHPVVDENPVSAAVPRAQTGTAQRADDRAAVDSTEIDTGPMPAQSSPVDENTGVRQRITLFGRRRNAEPPMVEPPVEEGSARLAELVRETDALVAASVDPVPDIDEHVQNAADGSTSIDGEGEQVAEPAPAVKERATAQTQAPDDEVPEWIIEQVAASDERDEALGSLEAEAETGVEAGTDVQDDLELELVDSGDVAQESADDMKQPPHARRAAATRSFPPRGRPRRRPLRSSSR